MIIFFSYLVLYGELQWLNFECWTSLTFLGWTPLDFDVLHFLHMTGFDLLIFVMNTSSSLCHASNTWLSSPHFYYTTYLPVFLLPHWLILCFHVWFLFFCTTSNVVKSKLFFLAFILVSVFIVPLTLSILIAPIWQMDY